MFADLEAAAIHANAMVKNLANGEAEIVRLSGEELLSYVRAKAAVAEFGLSLDSVAIEYRDAKRIVKGRSLLEPARYFAANQIDDLPSRTVSKVYEEMLESKKAEGLSERYLEDLRARGAKFAADFQVEIATVTGMQIKAWLQGLKRMVAKDKQGDSTEVEPISNRTRNNFRVAIQTLFAYAKAQKYLPRDWNGMEAVPVWKVKEDEVEIFTPAEFSTLLAVAESNLIPFLVIGAFAGLRSAEIERLDWSKVNLETGYITIDASIAKTNARRLVPITPNLKLWLQKFAKQRGPVLELSNLTNHIGRLVKATAPVDPSDSTKWLEPTVTWRHNALRHSFCSYRLADVKSAAQVALEAGNSPQMIFKHYRELVTEADAKKWFTIAPGEDGKVIYLQGQTKKAEKKENEKAA